MYFTWIAETRLEEVGQSKDEREARDDGDENGNLFKEIRTVEGEEQKTGGRDEEESEVENASLLGHDDPAAAEILKRQMCPQKFI